MAEKVLRTKIALLYRSYAEWDLVKDLYTPLRGEVCFCEVPASTGALVNEPAVIFKVGDGEKTFNELPWSSALAADVYAWAKKENLEFSDLSSSFLSSLDDRISSKSLNYLYQMADAGNGVWKLQRKNNVAGAVWEDVSTVDVASYLSPLLANKLDVMPGDTYTQGNPYNLPYYFYTEDGADKVTVHAKTVTLDGLKTQGDYSLNVNAASESKAGLMSASDKANLNKAVLEDDELILNCNL